MKKILSALLCSVLVIATFAGCSPADATPADESTAGESTESAAESDTEESPVAEGEQPFAGESIRIIFGNHVWTDAMKPKLEEFTQLTGIEIVSESYPEDQLNQKISVELASGGKNLDVFMTRPLQETKLFIKNGWLRDLEELMADGEYDAADFIPSALEIFQADGKTYGVPLVTEREILYYRKDLLEAAGIEVPTTFEELEAAAAALTDKDAGQYGFVARGLPAAAVTQFSSYLRGFGGDFHDAEYNATVNTPEAVEAFTYYGKMLREYGPPGTLNMHWQQAAGVYSQGNVALYTDADSIYNSVCGPDFPEVHEVTGFAPMPGGKPYNVTSWGLSIPAGTQKAEMALEFIRWATDKENIKFAQMAGVASSRQSVWDDPESTENYPPELVEAISASNKIGVSSDRPLNVQVGKARDEIGLILVAAVEGGDVQGVADKVNVEFQAILDEDFGG